MDPKENSTEEVKSDDKAQTVASNEVSDPQTSSDGQKHTEMETTGESSSHQTSSDVSTQQTVATLTSGIPSENCTLESVEDDIAALEARHTAADGESTGIRITSSEMEMAELRVKVVCQEKNNMALRMELKCAELQVAAKERVDAQKTRLVELLDAKVTSMEKKNLQLMDMVEQLIKEKEAHTRRLVDATKNMEDLAKQLQASERMKKDVINMNKELKTMLGNIEGKGSQIAKLAKEKLLKYKEENLKIQQELDTIKENRTEGDGGLDTEKTKKISELEDQLEKVKAQQDLVTFSEETSNRFSENWNKVSEIQRSIADSLRTNNTNDVDDLKKSLNTAGILNDELKVTLDTLRPGIDAVLTTTSNENHVLEAKVVALETQNVNLKETNKESDTASGASLSFQETIKDKEKRDGKDKEIESLKQELTRLKTAIQTLAGISPCVANVSS